MLDIKSGIAAGARHLHWAVLCVLLWAVLFHQAVFAQAPVRFAAGGAPAPMVYSYPPPESDADQRMNYYWEVLQSALAATTPKWGPFVLAPSNIVMNADRSQRMLSRSDSISVLVRTTSTERETVLRPILIPLDKGLTGYRLFLIQQPTQARLDHVQTLDELKEFSIGQGLHWVDADILRSSGLKVTTGVTYEALFKMLKGGRFDLLSRGVNEISKELAIGHTSNPDLAIEQHLLLYYPLPRYFFFARTPDGERLAQRVDEGLQMLLQNGEFDRQYKSFKRQILQGLNLSGRRVFIIANPTLSPQTPLGQREFWDTLAEELKPGR